MGNVVFMGKVVYAVVRQFGRIKKEPVCPESETIYKVTHFFKITLIGDCCFFISRK